MRAKKTALPAIEPAPVAIAAPKAFSREELLRYQLAEASFVNARQAVTIATHEAKALELEWQNRVQAMTQVFRARQTELEAQERALRALRDELGAKHNVDFERISFDPLTGIIHDPSTAN